MAATDRWDKQQLVAVLWRLVQVKQLIPSFDQPDLTQPESQPIDHLCDRRALVHLYFLRACWRAVTEPAQ